MMSRTNRTPIFDRSEPIFGVCEALGDDLGINPNIIRVSLAPLLFWNPVATIAGYFGMGLLLLMLRLLMPDVLEGSPAVDAPAPAPAADKDGEEALPLAA